MTIPAGELSISQYVGNGVADTFDYDFRIADESELTVTTTTDLGGDTVLILNTDYTVTGVGVDGGGSITLTAGALPTDYLIAIEDTVPISQLTPFGNQSSFFGSQHESALDKVTRLVRRYLGDFGRSLKIGSTVQGVSTDLPNPVSSNLLGWNAAADAIENVATVVGGIVTDGSITNAKLAAGAVFKKGADIASSNALQPGSDGNYFDVTGTNTITVIYAIGIGEVIKLHFDDVLTLTHHATDLILPGGVSIVTAAGDEAEFIEYSAGDWRCTNYQRANAELANHVRAGNTQVVDGDLTLNTLSVTVAVAEAVWESVGPTGSGADNIWVEMDVLPAAARILKANLNLTISPLSAASACEINVFVVSGDVASPVFSHYNNILGSISNQKETAADPLNVTMPVEIPLGLVNKDFQIYWNVVNESARFAGLDYRGFIADQ